MTLDCIISIGLLADNSCACVLQGTPFEERGDPVHIQGGGRGKEGLRVEGEEVRRG